MDPATTSQPFILNRPNGELRFSLLSPSSRVRVRNAFRFARKLQLYENLTLRGAPDDVAKKELNEFDARRLPESAVDDWIVNEPAGQQEAILHSLAMERPALLDAEGDARFKPVDDLGLTPAEMQEVGAAVMRIKLVWVTDGKDDKPDPTTAGTEATGAEKPTSSDAT